jgi:hypothetical protein
MYCTNSGMFSAIILYIFIIYSYIYSLYSLYILYIYHIFIIYSFFPLLFLFFWCSHNICVSLLEWWRDTLLTFSCSFSFCYPDPTILIFLFQVWLFCFLPVLIYCWTSYMVLFQAFFYSFIHMCIHCLGHFSPLSPTLPPPHFQTESVLSLSLILLKRRHKQ